MTTILTMLAILLAGIFLGFLFCVLAMRQGSKRARARKAKAEAPARKRFETTKLALWTCLIMGFAWVWCSYYLAYTDHPQIAESLSQVAVTEIIGVVLAYCIKSAVENLSKNNRWPDKGDSNEPPDSGGAG